MAQVEIALVVLAILPVLQAQMIYRGPCPVHPLEDDFDFNRFTGTWYEMNRTFMIFELGYTCVSAEYFINDAGNITLINRGQNFMGSTVSTGGKAMVPDPRRPAKLMVKVGRAPFWSSYMVLTTNYDHYALVWSCSNLGYLLHTETLWILSRNRTLDAEYQQEMKNFIRENKIRTRTLRATKQTDCNNFV